jgi:hypothetical protein
VERNKANESFPIPGLRRHALLCFAFEATKQQASAKKKEKPRGAAAAATSIKRKILGRGRSAPFCSTAREILDAIARASKSTTSSTQYSHSNYCRRVRERWMRAAGESSADRASFFGRSKLMCCGRQRGGFSSSQKAKSFLQIKDAAFSLRLRLYYSTLLSRDTAFLSWCLQSLLLFISGFTKYYN